MKIEKQTETTKQLTNEQKKEIGFHNYFVPVCILDASLMVYCVCDMHDTYLI